MTITCICVNCLLFLSALVIATKQYILYIEKSVQLSVQTFNIPVLKISRCFLMC